MIRNLKALGLALMALAALGAVIASGASAQEQGELTSDGPVTLTGTEVGGETENRLTAFGGYVQCPGSTYTGHKVLTEHETETRIEHEFLPANGSTTATLTPHYKEAEDNCSGPLGVSATVDMNGCDYVVHLGKTNPPENNEGTFAVTFDIACPKDQEITVTLWKSKAEHTEKPNTPFCDLHVADEDTEGNPTNQGLSGAHATNEVTVIETEGGEKHEERDIRLKGTVEGIHVTRTLTHGEPGLLCANGSVETGKFDLNVTVKGHEELNESTEVWISEV